MIQQQKQRDNSQRTTDSPQRLTVGEIVVAAFNLLLGGAPLALFAYVWLSYTRNPPEYGPQPSLFNFQQYLLMGVCLAAVFAGVAILVRARALASLLLMLFAIIAFVIAIAVLITLDRGSRDLSTYLFIAVSALFGLLQGLAALWLRRMQA
ncbi:MAG: hypothetical protein NTX57_13580 [Armatimonadetes bacterium]|nr:hypothetical protein [Armatimonadota bacterium]